MIFRTALENDLDALIALLNDDHIAQFREHTNPTEKQTYRTALLDIINNENTDIYVTTENDGTIIGMAQLFILPHISRMGGKRAQVESRSHCPKTSWK